MLTKHALRFASVILTSLLCSNLFAFDNLPPNVLKLLSKYQIPTSAVSAQVSDLHSGQTYISHLANTARNPASVMKLITTLAALELLGPAYSWQTKYYFNGKLKDGVLNGDLVIKGHGDPYLVTEQFWLHLRALRELGLRKITGHLLIDNSAFDLPEHDPAAFDKKPYRLYNVGPSATMVNFNASRFKLVSDPPVVRIKLDPPMDSVVITDQLRLKKGKCIGQENGWRMDTKQVKHRAHVTFKGHYRSGCNSYDYRRAVLPADAYLFGLFKQLWASLGGEFDGGYAFKSVTDNAKPVYIGSGKNLSETIIGTNKYSNNLLAQHLLLTIALEHNKPHAATRRAAIKSITDWLTTKGISANSIRIANGSGLSRQITLSSNTLDTLLQAGWNSHFRPEFLSSFSLAGIDGTAKKRFRKSNAKGRVRIKTGYLRGVRTMGAYVKTDSGKWLSANLLIEHPKVNFPAGNHIQDAFIQALLTDI